jgi:V/A-type H+-transporting ATPase subunit D
MRLNINPTRMELLNLKKRVIVAKRGYRLLKEKRDGLMREFLALLRENRKLREEIEQELIKGYMNLTMAQAVLTPLAVDSALMSPQIRLKLTGREKNVMGVNVPMFEMEFEGDIYSYGLVDTSGELDIALESFRQVILRLLKLAEVERAVELLAVEIERTRRRVNALEFVMIPNLEETVKYISMKLDERERANIVRLMKVKDIIGEQEIEIGG